MSLEGKYGQLELVSEVDTSKSKIVPYDPKKDLCILEGYTDFDCSPNYVVARYDRPNDSKYNYLWGLRSRNGIKAEKAWDITKIVNESVISVVIDSGIDINHPELKNNIWGTYNAINGSKDIKDENGHGTHVAGTICAEGNNKIGVTGVAWKCNLMGIKFLGRNGAGSLYGALKAVNYVETLAKRHPDKRFVINASYGSGGRSSSMQKAIERLNTLGVIFVAAAGNESRNIDSFKNYPSNYNVNNIISVGAIDSRERLASFSNYGVKNTDIVAPGVNIYSLAPNGKYITMSGTSMATPHVAGAVSLLLSLNTKLKVSEVKEKLFETGTDIPSLKSKIGTGKTLNLENLLRSVN